MLRRQLMIFLVVGSSTVLVDFVSYRLLLSLLGMSLDSAKTLSFILGTVYAYLANRRWTFNHAAEMRKTILPFLGVYACSLGLNVGTNAFCFQLLTGIPYALTVAFLVATGVSAAFNFIGMKLLVFRHPK